MIRNVPLVQSQHMWMISEESCDTEDWSNECWKFSFAMTEINDSLKYSNIENSYCKLQ